jgi:hypothetical protein
MMLRLLIAACCLVAPMALGAQDAKLIALRKTLLPMRDYGDGKLRVRGATPQLTVAKHQLRDWIESHLRPLPNTGDEAILAEDLNQALGAANLVCDFSDELPCPEWFQLGYVGPIRIQRREELLIVETAVGIECGFDESAYVYSSEGDHHKWQRLWESEQNIYTEKGYKPQTIDSVEVSLDYRTKDYMVLTVGQQPWCMSNWHYAYYRLWHWQGGAEPKLLLDQAEDAFVSSGVKGRVIPHDALVEFTMASLDGMNRETIRHYRVEGDKATRIDPIALGPQDFVAEWLQSARGKKVALKAGSQSFILPTMHCRSAPDLWQVGIEFGQRFPPVLPIKATYFIVRWRPPYRFTMRQVRETPLAGCTEKDPDADEPRTLFADWR